MKTISLELARELKSVCKDKNVTMPESYHSWYEYRNGVYCLRNTDNGKTVYKYIAPAFTLDELLEWLFAKTNYISIKSDIRPKKGWTAWGEKKGWMTYQEDQNPANAACKLLIWLIKEGLLNG